MTIESVTHIDATLLHPRVNAMGVKKSLSFLAKLQAVGITGQLSGNG